MPEHLTEQEIENYRRRERDPDRQTTAAHLAVCPSCLQRVLEPAHSAVAVSALTEAFLPTTGEEPFHLSSADLKNYAAGSFTEADRIICESHTEICEECYAELRLLTRAQVLHKLPRTRTIWGLKPARLAAAIALIGLLTLAVLVLWQRSSRSTRQESVKNGVPGIPESALPPDYVPPAAPSNPPVVASLKDNNREISLDQDGKIAGLDGFDESTQRLVKTALAGEGLAKPKVLDDLSSAPIRLLDQRPSEVAFQLLGPSRKVITELRPTFSWRPLSGASSYVVSVFDSNFNRVGQSPPLSRTNWTIDEPLRRGQTYSWEVTATKDGKEIKAPVAPAARAQFKLLEADKVNTLSKLKQQKPVSHLALGLTYARFGLLNEAEAEFRKLGDENPDSAVAKRLLRTVDAWAR